ncbi:MAG: hypothetical protein BGO51_27970 [Rhodospirillales bacterium 69-11]|mgnify:CR=1 FL=1|nr:ATP-binding protein [Rhodospirillales bacterium]OJW25157.1 MAG: hypothetical protein BGO51_27970 [Rhodospirillales bacterium 69-11]
MAGEPLAVLSCRIPATEAGLAELGPWVDTLCARFRLAAESEYALRLCLEEVVANIVMHAGAAGTPIALCVRLEPGSMTARIEDEGAPFDPTRAQPPDILPKEGGRGLGLLQCYARAITYRRDAGRNCLTLTLAR